MRPGDFYRPAHQLIYDAILDLYGARRAGRRGHRLGRADPRRPAGPRRRRALPAHADLARPDRGQRRLLRRRSSPSGPRCAGWSPPAPASCRWATTTASGSTDVAGTVDDVVDRAQAEIYDVTERRTSEDYVHIETLLQPHAGRDRQDLGSTGGIGTGIPTGFQPARRDHQRPAPRADDHRRRPSRFGQVDARAGLRPLGGGQAPASRRSSSPWRWASIEIMMRLFSAEAGGVAAEHALGAHERPGLDAAGPPLERAGRGAAVHRRLART